MSAPQIPNLNSLRRGGLKGRGRGTPSSNTENGERSANRQANKDEIIRNTDNDAATSRLSAVEAGYLDDPFAKLLSGNGEVIRRLPLMNRGTYVRTTAIDRIVATFLSSAPRGRRKQIISLGAGSDTRYFRLLRQYPDIDLLYHEFDFPANTSNKITRLLTPSFVSAAKTYCGGIDLSASTTYHISENSTRLTSPNYHIHPIDLRTLATLSSMPSSTTLPTSPTTSPNPHHALSSTLDTTLPTLLISECCLIYLTPLHADGVLSLFTSHLFPPSSGVPLAIAVYEPIVPDDAFGRTMVANLIQRGIVLQTLEKYRGLTEQRGRLNAFGFGPVIANKDMAVNAHEVGGDDGVVSNFKRPATATAGAEAYDINQIYTCNKWIPPSEKERIEALEWMDEVEEFVLLAKHYCVAFGWRGFDGTEGDKAQEGQSEDNGWKALLLP